MCCEDDLDGSACLTAWHGGKF